MPSGAYYNEHDPFAAAWLRNLIAAGHIALGDVDTRDIREVKPDDLRSYTQCHFFAGVGIWSAALRLAGWDDDRPVWTGSCPCQPFSAAGKRKAGADDRHLWPAWLGLIRESKPDTLLGEQVEGAVRLGWLDRVFADLEEEGYACGSSVLGAHSVGAPNIRQRLWWVADANGRRECGVSRRQSPAACGDEGKIQGCLGQRDRIQPVGDCADGRLADTGAPGRGTLLRPNRTDRRPEIEPDRHGDAGGLVYAAGSRCNPSGRQGERDGVPSHEAPQPAERGGAGWLEHADQQRREGQRLHVRSWGPLQGSIETAGGSEVSGVDDPAIRGRARQDWTGIEEQGLGARRPNDWRNAYWLPCTDGKVRPVPQSVLQWMAHARSLGLGLDGMPPEAGHPLAKSIKGRVGALRGFGNAIVLEAAAEFIRAYLDVRTP